MDVTPAEQPCCKMRHRGEVKAVEVLGGVPMCRRHLNRSLQDIRIADYIEDGPRCPEHPDRTPRVTRWFGQDMPRLHCSAPRGEAVHYGSSGRGVFHRPAGSTYTEWCGWQHEIPGSVVRGQ